MDKPTIFSDNPTDKLSKSITFKAGEHFTFSKGEWCDYSESQYTALVDFNLYDAFVEYIKVKCQNTDGSYQIKDIVLGTSVDFKNVLEVFLELVDANDTQWDFVDFLKNRNYIKPLVTKNISLGSFPYFEMTP